MYLLLVFKCLIRHFYLWNFLVRYCHPFLLSTLNVFSDRSFQGISFTSILSSSSSSLRNNRLSNVTGHFHQKIMFKTSSLNNLMFLLLRETGTGRDTHSEQKSSKNFRNVSDYSGIGNKLIYHINFIFIRSILNVKQL
jgi:hypothetical protein